MKRAERAYSVAPISGGRRLTAIRHIRRRSVQSRGQRALRKPRYKGWVGSVFYLITERI